MMRLQTVALMVLVSSTGLGSTAAFAQEKLGFVDLQRALMETEEGRKARTDLKKVFDQKQKELDEQQNELKKGMEDLDKKRTLLPADKVKEKETEMQSRLEKIRQTYLRHQQDLQSKEQEATGKIFERMQRIIGKIATSENFTMIFDRQQSGLVFAKPHLDLTNEVIRRYNAGEGKDGAPATKPPGTVAPAPKK
ncbi:MAG TPA: OmpH family outer membrane protein [Polyangia bacterium]